MRPITRSMTKKQANTQTSELNAILPTVPDLTNSGLQSMGLQDQLIQESELMLAMEIDPPYGPHRFSRKWCRNTKRCKRGKRCNVKRRLVMANTSTKKDKVKSKVVKQAKVEGRTVRGIDQLVLLSGNELKPSIEPVTKRMKPVDLDGHPDCVAAFICQKNFSKNPNQNKGSLIYFPERYILCYAMKFVGARGVVRQIAPKEGAGTIHKINNGEVGFYLQQVRGAPLTRLDAKARSIQIDMDGKIVPLLDNLGYLKMNHEGPDIALVEKRIPKQFLKWILNDNLVTVEKNTEKRIGSKECYVSTLYVFPKNDYDPTYVAHPHFGVPVGPQIPSKNGSQK